MLGPQLSVLALQQSLQGTHLDFAPRAAYHCVPQVFVAPSQSVLVTGPAQLTSPPMYAPPMYAAQVPYGAPVQQLPQTIHWQQQQSEFRPQHYHGVQYEVHPQFGMHQSHQAEVYPRMALPQYHCSEVQPPLATPGYGNQAGRTGGMHLSPAPPADADCVMSEGDEEERPTPSRVSLFWQFDLVHMPVLDQPPTITQTGKHVSESQSKDYCNDVQLSLHWVLFSTCVCQ